MRGLLSLVVSAGAVSWLIAAEPTTWPTLAGPNGDMSSPEVGILTAWPKTGLVKLWDAPLGAGYAPPVVAAGRCFHVDGAPGKTVLSCRHSATGELQWQYETPCVYEDRYGYDDGPRACPVIDGERIIIHTVDGKLACVSATTGKELWLLDTKAKYTFHQNFFGVASVPIVVGNSCLVPVGGSPKGPRPQDFRQAKGNGSGFVAVDKTTGVVKYATLDDLASYSSPVLATFHGKATVLYLARGGLVGIDPATGQERLRYPWRSKTLESVNAANPVVTGDTILLSESYELGSVMLRVKRDFTLDVVWSNAEQDRREKALASHWCTPVVHEGAIYGCSGRNESEADLRCLDAATGAVRWIAPRTRRCTITKVDGHLLVLSEDGNLMLVKPNAEKFVKVAEWSERTNPDLAAPCWAPPVVAEGRLYLRGKGKLICCQLCK